MRTFADVIARWPNAVQFAADVQVQPVRARKWRNRNSIPSSQWQTVVKSAHGRGFTDITVDLLAEIAARSDD